MIVLTILNTIAIFCLFFKRGEYYINIRKNTTFIKDTVVSYSITLWKKENEFCASGVYTLEIPIKNRKKVEREEEIERMMSYDDTGKFRSLSSKFSWLKTWDQVKEFEKHYSVVDRKIVENLVSGFLRSQNKNG